MVEKRTIDSESAETKDGTITERTQFLARVVVDVKTMGGTDNYDMSGGKSEEAAGKFWKRPLALAATAIPV